MREPTSATAGLARVNVKERAQKERLTKRAKEKNGIEAQMGQTSYSNPNVGNNGGVYEFQFG